MKKLLALAFLIPALQACGKKDNAQNADQIVAAPIMVPGPGQISGAPPPTILGQAPYFYVNYEVKEPNCTTGLRRFSGPDHYYVKNLMCQSFLNNWMNQNCGQAQRYAWYRTYCP